MNRIERFGVRKIETDKGQPRWQVVGRKPDGNRVRLRFETEEEAVGKKSELEIEALNLQDSFRLCRTRLTEAQLLEAESTYQKLDGLSLCTAVEFALKHYRAPITQVTVEEATKRFMSEKTHSKRRERTVGEYRKEFARLTALHGQRLVCDIRCDDLRALIYRKPNQSAVTINHHIERLHAFFAWCVRNQYAVQNPVTFGKATADQKQPEILDNEIVKRLLWAAMNLQEGILVSYFALSLFTGIRPAELGRLSLQAVLHHQERVINLEGDVAKVRNSRLVDVQSNLPEWIQISPKAPIASRRLVANSPFGPIAGRRSHGPDARSHRP